MIRDPFHELLGRAKGGDVDALNALLVQLRPYLKAIAARQLDSRLLARQDASDLVQNTLIDGIHGFARFAGSSEAELRAYFKRILKTNTIDALRAQVDALCRSVDAERSIDVTEDTSRGGRVELVAEVTSPSQAAARNELMARLLDAMRDLPERQRAALGLWQSGCSYRQIAERLGCNEGAAQSLVKHARKRLREVAGEDDSDPA